MSKPVGSSPPTQTHLDLTYREDLPDIHSLDPYLQQFWARHLAPARRCGLFPAHHPEPVSSIWQVEYVVRVGCAHVPAIGFAAGATQPHYRRRGLFTELMREAMVRARTSAPIAFLKGIDGFYKRLGFVPFCPERKFRLSRGVLAHFRADTPDSIHLWHDRYKAAACALYNQQHARRTGTSVRDPEHFLGPRATDTWMPGDEAAVCLRRGHLVGYVFTTHLPFGQSWRRFEVREIVAADLAAAAALLAYVRELAVRARRGNIEIDEPPDSVVGGLLRLTTCTFKERSSADGGWMAAVLDRGRLIDLVDPEIDRRFASGSASATQALRMGRLLTDTAALAHALLRPNGWAEIDQLVSAERRGSYWLEFRERCAAGVAEAMPTPFLHASDRF